nr:hypothetical protein [Tanacetum cinerariifolium]
MVKKSDFVLAPPWRWWLSCQPQPYHDGGSGWKSCCRGCCGGGSGGVSGVEWWCSGGADCRRAAAVAVGVLVVRLVMEVAAVESFGGVVVHGRNMAGKKGRRRLWRWWRRGVGAAVTERRLIQVVGRIYRNIGSNFGVCRKISPENFFGNGGGGWPEVMAGRRLVVVGRENF